MRIELHRNPVMIENKGMATNSMVIFTRAAMMLAEADTIQKAKELKSLALTAGEWAKRKGMGEDAIRHCRSYALEAERKMGEMLIAGQADGRVAGKGHPKRNVPSGDISPVRLTELGLSRKESSSAKSLAALPRETFEAVKDGQTTRAEVRRKENEARREKQRGENREKIAGVVEPKMLKATFSSILIDPPWDWGDEGDNDQLGRARPDYATLSLDELLALPVGELAAEDCHLYLWITNRSLPKGFQLVERWGFRYITALTWPKPSFGMGNYFRGQTEHLLFGVKGSQLLKRKDASTLLPAWSRGKGGHSSKPVEIHEFIESCSPGPYLEMFNRVKREDWTQWGEDS